MAGDTVSDATLWLLWEACRREPNVEAIREAASGDIQPSRLVDLALANRIAPLLWRALVTAGCESHLGDQRSRIEELANLYRLQAFLLHPQAVALAVGALTAAGLEPMVMKGPAVSRHYPEPGLRPMDDLDLLLPPESHSGALSALVGAGWTVSRPKSRDFYDTQLRHPDVPSMPLELHYGLEGWHERSNDLDPMWLWRRRVPFDCLGTPAFGLPFEEEIVSLAAHAGKPYHGFDRMIWLADLGMVIGYAQAHGGFDWDRLEELAAQTQCTTVVTAALLMARRMGLVVPEPQFALPTRGWRSVPLHRLLDLDWPVAHDHGMFHLRFSLVDSTWRRLGLLAAVPYHSSWSERLHLPTRGAARLWDVLRRSRAQAVQPDEVHA
jgi:putative nucleotidyltransferase-like protein